jgi:hypothetical protein
MFDQVQKDLALSFARALAAKDFARANGMLSAAARSQTAPDTLQSDWEAMIPPEFGRIHPIELFENPAFDELFVYVVLGGEVYSEAIMVEAFVSEDGAPKIDRFQFGRP